MKFFMFNINFFILIFNLFLIIYYEINYNKASKITIYFKNSDYFSIGLSNREYKDLSNFLNSKYTNINPNKFLLNNLNLFQNKKKLKTKKKVTIDCVDLFHGQIEWFKNMFKDDLNFIFIFDSNSPDYLIFNKFGDKHFDPKYKNSIKIAFYTENKIPDLAEVDYAIGHQHINYLDRYFKYNIFLRSSFKLTILEKIS